MVLDETVPFDDLRMLALVYSGSEQPELMLNDLSGFWTSELQKSVKYVETKK